MIIITSSGFEIEVTAKVAKLHSAMYEVPISYHGRTYEQGKKIGFMDGVAALWYILKSNLLCSLKESFRVVPGRATQWLSKPREAQSGPSRKSEKALLNARISANAAPAQGECRERPQRQTEGGRIGRLKCRS